MKAQTATETPIGGSLHPVVRRRGRRGRMKRGWGQVRTPQTPKPPAARKVSAITEHEFVEAVREWSAEPKWKNPTQWDEHTFRVGVQLTLRRVTPNDQAQAQPL